MGLLEKMKEGNQRYVSRISNSLNRNLEQPFEVACKKKPFVAVVACFDSPIAPEVIFDCDSRDILVVQAAGNLIKGTSKNRVKSGWMN